MNLGKRISAVDGGEKKARDRVIVRTSLLGILANVFLAAFKAFVGLMSNSIAVVMDAVNNLSDAASSIITIVGTKLAGKAPDRDHPFGHGRGEYLTAMIIAVIVLYAGVTSLIESARKILRPETPSYTATALVILAVAVAVKIFLGRYVSAVGRRVHSNALANSGRDALMDSVISAATLAAAGIYLAWGISLEAWLAAAISLVIVKSGVDMIRETISQLLGERVDAELARDIKATVCSFPDVSGAYDLVLNNYGPDAFNGSVHIEVPDTYSASDLDELIRKITIEVYRKHNVLLTAVGVYSVNTKDARIAGIQQRIRDLVMAHENVLEMHGFFLNEEKKTIRFDVVISFDEKDRAALQQAIVEEIEQICPGYELQVTLDTDFSES